MAHLASSGDAWPLARSATAILLRHFIVRGSCTADATVSVLLASALHISPPPPEPPALEELSECIFGRGDGTWVWSNEVAQTRICVQDGRIAWVHCTSLGIYLADRLAHALGVPIEALREHLLACRRTDRRLAEYLAETGVMSRARLRSVLQWHNAEHLDAFLLHGSDHGWDRSELDPKPERYDERMTFTLEELLMEDEDPDEEQPTVGEQLLDELIGIQGALGAALVDYELEGCLAVMGIDPPGTAALALGHVDMWRASVATMEALAEGPVQGVTSTRLNRFEIVWPVPGSSHFVFAIVDLQCTTPALALTQLRLATERVLPA